MATARKPAPPRSAAEIQAWLVQQIADLVGAAPETIDPRESFDTFGLSSREAVMLSGDLEEWLGRDLSPTLVYEHPTLAQLAQALGAANPETAAASPLDDAPPMPAADAARPVAGEYPLSDGQRALWFQHQAAPDSIAHPTHAVRLRGPLSIEALRAAFLAAAQRHSALRTTFRLKDGAPVQVIGPEATLAFSQVTATGWTDERLRTALLATAGQPFDIDHGPLLRVAVFSRAADDHVLLFSVHHLVVDLWSLTVLFADVDRFYRDPALRAAPPLGRQFIDFAAWQAALLGGPAGERLWEYWRGQLTPEPPLLNLPTDRPRLPTQTFRAGGERLTLDAALTRSLKALGEREGVSLYMLLLAAFQLLLARYTGQTDFVVGTPTTGRSRNEFAEVVGYCVNPVALRARLVDDTGAALTLPALLRQVRQTVLDALAHQDYPIARLVERLRPQRFANRTPLFQVMFVFQSTPRSADRVFSSVALGAGNVTLNLAGLPVETLTLEDQAAPFDLTLTMAEAGEELGAAFTYNADLFDAATIRRLAGHFATLLAGLAADPDRPLPAQPLLDTAERRQIVEDWNATDAPFDLSRPAAQLIEAQAARAPEAVAVSLGGQTLTYAELERRANQLAHSLQARGVGADTLVAVCLEPSLAMAVAVLGTLKAGGAYLPLDPRYPAERLAFMLQDSAAPLLLTTAALAPGLPASAAQVICLDTDWPTIAQAPGTTPPSPATPDSLAYVIYTSGSTGTPKGTLLHQRGLTNLIHVLLDKFALTPESRVLQFASFSFDASVSEIVVALAAGARLVLAPRETLRAPSDLLALLRREAITCVTVPPSLLSVLAPDDLPALATVVSAGEPCPWEVAERWAAGRRLLNGYGPTEATVAASYYRVGERVPGTQTVPIGRPNPNTHLYVLDAHQQPVPVGVPGELYIGGVGVGRGYLNRPELTAERFIQVDSSRWTVDGRSASLVTAHPPLTTLYRTGDLVRWLPSGDLEFLGRLDDQVKVRGFRIELGEIEAALRTHPAVREAAVVVRAADDGDRRLSAYVVTTDAEGRRSDLIAAVRAHLRERLPDYMVPGTVTVLEALPLTPNGKVDRQALARLRPQRAEPGADFVQPQNELERVIAGLWQAALDVERVGSHDNFFELGGHSLLVVKVQDQLQQALGREVPIVDLFQYPTVAALAQHLSRAEAGPSAVETGQARAEKQKAALLQQQERLRAAAAQRAARRPGGNDRP